MRWSFPPIFGALKDDPVKSLVHERHRLSNFQGAPLSADASAGDLGPGVEDGLLTQFNLTDDRFIRLPEVLRLTGLSRSALYRLQDAGFPQSVQLSKHSVAWVFSEVEKWCAARVVERADRRSPRGAVMSSK